MAKSLRGQISIYTPPEPGASVGAIGYSSVANGTNPADVTFPITAEQIAMVQYGGSDWQMASFPAVSGDSTHSCWWKDLNAADADDDGDGHGRYSGGGFVTGDGTVTLSLSATTGNRGGYMNVIVVAYGSHECATSG